jgi:hypothetical protein
MKRDEGELARGIVLEEFLFILWELGRRLKEGDPEALMQRRSWVDLR